MFQQPLVSLSNRSVLWDAVFLYGAKNPRRFAVLCVSVASSDSALATTSQFFERPCSRLFGHTNFRQARGLPTLIALMAEFEKFMFMKNFSCLVALSSFSLTLFLSTTTQAGVISFNLRSTGTGGTSMALTEQAGALGVNHDNWNDVLASTSIGTTLAAGAILDETGAIASGVAFSVTKPSFPEQWKGVGNGTRKMLSSGFDIGPVANASDLKISLTGISYATYDVYVYGVGGGSRSRFRGGEVWLNGFQTGTLQSMRHLSNSLNTSYVLANDTDPFDNSTAPRLILGV